MKKNNLKNSNNITEIPMKITVMEVIVRMVNKTARHTESKVQ
jgi:hypothetical protein